MQGIEKEGTKMLDNYQKIQKNGLNVLFSLYLLDSNIRRGCNQILTIRKMGSVKMKKVILLCLMFVLAFTTSTFAESNNITKPDLQELSKETGIEVEKLEELWTEYENNNFNLELANQLETQNPSLSSTDEYLPMSTAPTYKSTFNLAKQNWYLNDFWCKSTSSSTKSINVIEAKARMYGGGVLMNQNTDTQTNTTYAGTGATASFKLFFNGSGTGYGNNYYKLTGYRDVYHQFSKNFTY